jgi:hypothetical protein
MYRIALNVTLLLVIAASAFGAAVYLNRQFSSTIVATLVLENDSEFIDFLRQGESAFALAHRIASGLLVAAVSWLVISAVRMRGALGRADCLACVLFIVTLAAAVAASCATRWSVPLASSQPSLLLHCFALPGVAAMLLIVLLARDKLRRTEAANAPTGAPAGRVRAGLLFVSCVSGMLVLASLETIYTLFVTPVTFDGAVEVLVLVLVSLGMGALTGMMLWMVAVALVMVMLFVFDRLAARRSSQAFALAVISTIALDAALFIVLYGFEDLRFLRLYVAVDFVIALASILALYPLAANLKSILDRKAHRAEMSGADLGEALAEAWASVPFYPLVKAWRLIARKPAACATSRPRAGLMLAAAWAALFGLDMLAFHTYGWYIHVVLSVLLVIFFSMFWLLVVKAVAERRTASAAGVRSRRPAAVLAAASLALAAAPFVLLECAPDTKCIACNRTELLKTEVLMVQRLLDLDRDGFSALLGGGDADDLDASVNPLAGDFRNFVRRPDEESRRPRVGERIEVPCSDRVNVIVFCIEATRPDVMGCYGAPRSVTPAIDAFARESILYERAYAPGPATPISQYSMLAGRFARRLIWQTVPPDNYLSLFFRDGFANIAAQGLLLDERNFRLMPGSLAFDLTLLPVTDYLNTSREQYEDLVRFLGARDRSKRTFLWVQFLDPHFGFVHHDEVEDFGDSPRGGYLNELLYTDKYIGKSLEYLKAAGLWEDSIVVVTADHGTELFDHGKYFHGQELYEESVHVPLIVHFPPCFAGAAPGRQPRRVGTAVSMLTLLSSLYAWTTGAFEVREPGAGPLPLEDRGPGEAYLVSAYDDKFGVVAGATKMIYNRAFDTYEVYDLEKDPGERRNLGARDHEELRQLLLEFIARHRDTYRRECPLDFK